MRIVVLFILFQSVLSNLQSQKIQPGKNILFSVDTLKTTADEFYYALNKNNYSGLPLTRKEVDEYLDLYIKFKLKVADAYHSGLDTTSAFLKEFHLYKNQLDDSYLRKDPVLDSMISLEYERMQWELSGSHILVSIKDPSDTLSALQKINSIYEMASGGGSFEELAIKYSDDPSVRINRGYLGYFTALQLVYPFEETAYSTPVGGISKPFRTRFGYHLVKIMDKRSNQGFVTVAHIMIRFGQEQFREDSVFLRNKIYDLYDQLKIGGNWDDLCRLYSEDFNTKNNGGVLPEFNTGGMIPEISEISFSLQHPGAISEPVKSPYGWHIIKLIQKRPLPSLSEIRADLKQRLEQGEWKNIIDQEYIKRLKMAHGYKFNPDILDQCLLRADSSLFTGQWSYDKNDLLAGKIIVSLHNHSYTVSDFFSFLKSNPPPSGRFSPETAMRNFFEEFSESILLESEKNNLGKKFPDYNWLVKEYKEGILMFTLMESKVWNRGTEDSIGLAHYFELNRSRYTWGERADAVILSANDTSLFSSIREMVKNGLVPMDDSRIIFSTEIPEIPVFPDSLIRILKSDTNRVLVFRYHPTIKDQVWKVISASDLGRIDTNRIIFLEKPEEGADFQLYTKSLKHIEKFYNSIDHLNIKVETGKFEKGSDQLVDPYIWEPGEYYASIDEREYLIWVRRIFPSEWKNLDEAKGLVISDYQNFLEGEWIHELKNTYEIKIDKKVLNKVYQKIEN